MNPFGDLYCYPGTMVLANKLGIKGQDELDEVEADIKEEKSDRIL